MNESEENKTETNPFLKLESDNIRKELEFIQNIITRMANNSFLLKGWTISLIVAVLVITKDNIISTATDSKYGFIVIYCILLTATFGFWWLDSFFLYTEKRYRKFYDWVLEKRKEGKDTFYFGLNLKKFEENIEKDYFKEITFYKDVFWSSTLKTFYIIQISLLTALLMYSLFNLKDRVICQEMYFSAFIMKM